MRKLCVFTSMFVQQKKKISWCPSAKKIASLKCYFALWKWYLNLFLWILDLSRDKRQTAFIRKWTLTLRKKTLRWGQSGNFQLFLPKHLALDQTMLKKPFYQSPPNNISYDVGYKILLDGFLGPFNLKIWGICLRLFCSKASVLSVKEFLSESFKLQAARLGNRFGLTHHLSWKTVFTLIILMESSSHRIE